MKGFAPACPFINPENPRNKCLGFKPPKHPKVFMDALNIVSLNSKYFG